MKMKQFLVRGFRSLKEVTWQPEPLNVLIGLNGSGKSNLLRAMELLQQGVTGNLEKSVVEQGGLGAILWDGQSSKLEWNLNADPSLLFGEEAGAITYNLMLENPFGLANYRIEREFLGDLTRKGLPNQPFKYLERDPNQGF